MTIHDVLFDQHYSIDPRSLVLCVVVLEGNRFVSVALGCRLYSLRRFVFASRSPDKLRRLQHDPTTGFIFLNIRRSWVFWQRNAQIFQYAVRQWCATYFHESDHFRYVTMSLWQISVVLHPKENKWTCHKLDVSNPTHAAKVDSKSAHIPGQLSPG